MARLNQMMGWPGMVGSLTLSLLPSCSLASLVRGQVLTTDGTPLVGVNVSFVNYPHYGYTLTRQDGMYVKQRLLVQSGNYLTVSVIGLVQIRLDQFKLDQIRLGLDQISNFRRNLGNEIYQLVLGKHQIIMMLMLLLQKYLIFPCN